MTAAALATMMGYSTPANKVDGLYDVHGGLALTSRPRTRTGSMGHQRRRRKHIRQNPHLLRSKAYRKHKK